MRKLRQVALVFAGLAALVALGIAWLRTPAGTEAVLNMLREAYPNTQFLSVENTSLEGLYSVVMARNSAFTDAEGKSFIFGGTLVDMEKQEVLKVPKPGAALAQATGEALAKPAAFTYVTSQPAALTVTVFTDVDCPYCTRLENEIGNIPNLRVDTFLFPKVSNHPKAPYKSVQIWCSPERVELFRTVMLNHREQKKLLAGLPADCPHPVDANVRLAAKIGVKYTPTSIAPNGEYLVGYKPAAKYLAWIKANQK